MYIDSTVLKLLVHENVSFKWILSWWTTFMFWKFCQCFKPIEMHCVFHLFRHKMILDKKLPFQQATNDIQCVLIHSAILVRFLLLASNVFKIKMEKYLCNFEQIYCHFFVYLVSLMSDKSILHFLFSVKSSGFNVRTKIHCLGCFLWNLITAIRFTGIWRWSLVKWSRQHYGILLYLLLIEYGILLCAPYWIRIIVICSLLNTTICECTLLLSFDICFCSNSIDATK